jgi:hypothetical protein
LDDRNPLFSLTASFSFGSFASCDGIFTMALADDFLKAVFQIGEGARKEGFTTGGVTYQYNQNDDTITGTFTIPVTPTYDSETKSIKYTAKDAFSPPV